MLLAHMLPPPSYSDKREEEHGTWSDADMRHSTAAERLSCSTSART